MRILLLCVFTFGLPTTVQLCSSPNIQVKDKCFSSPPIQTSVSDGYKICAQQGSPLPDVKDHADIDDLIVYMNRTRTHSLWLGLTCLSNDFSSCQWDSGLKSKYSNFRYGTPNATIGPCVSMDSTGRWDSLPCNYKRQVACQLNTKVELPICKDNVLFNTTTFRGMCYYTAMGNNLTSATQSCCQTCGALASIRTEGENSYVRDLMYQYYSSSKLRLLGLYQQNDSYAWADGSAYGDYKNFGEDTDPDWGTCVAMASYNSLVPCGQWFNYLCDYFSTTPFTYVCKRDVANFCDQTGSTEAPLQCAKKQTIKGSSVIYSPGFPRDSLANVCEYSITEPANTFASITFSQLSLDNYSSISLYNTILPANDEPTIWTNMSNVTEKTFCSATNTMKVVFNTPGYNNVSANLFQVTVTSVPKCL